MPGIPPVRLALPVMAQDAARAGFRRAAREVQVHFVDA